MAPFPLIDVTAPAVWDRWAAGLDLLLLEPEHVVVVAPHPDDETLGCGGLVASLVERGAEVTIVTVSDGGASHLAQPDLANWRRKEQAAAVAALGCRAQPVWLGLPDGHLGAFADHVRSALVGPLRDADLIVAPWSGDGHPDHEIVGRASQQAAPRRARFVSYPVWLWRWGTPADVAHERCVRLDLAPSAQRAKATAMGCFPSQTTELAGDVIVDSAMLDRFARPFEVLIDG